MAMIGQEDIKWIPTGDTGRMDAVWIVHGLPVTLIDRLDEFREQYENTRDFPARESSISIPPGSICQKLLTTGS